MNSTQAEIQGATDQEAHIKCHIPTIEKVARKATKVPG
jgi:hypothetical protein